MKRSLKNLLMTVMILASLIGGSFQPSPAEALGQPLEQNLSLPSVPSTWYEGQLRDVSGSGAATFTVGHGKVTSSSGSLPLIYEKPNWTSPIVPGLPSGIVSGTFEGVWAADTAVAYTVGAGKNADGVYFPLIYKRSSGSWVSQSPNLTVPAWSSWSSPSLEDVWGTSTINVFAVGNGTHAGKTKALIVRTINGIDWTPITVPDLTSLTSSYLEGIWGTSDGTKIVAVGTGSQEVIIGSETKYIPVPLLYQSVDSGSNWSALTLSSSSWEQGQLYGVWGSGSNDIYVVGSGTHAGSAELMPLVYRYNGILWQDISSQLLFDEESGELFGVWGSSATDIYLAGSVIDGTKPLLYRRRTTSSSWAASSPLTAGVWGFGNFASIWGAGPDDVYTVGNGFKVSAPATRLPLLSHAGEDTSPSGPVTGLTAEPGTANRTVKLTWIAPADDAANPISGPVDRYKVIYSKSTLTDCSSGTVAPNPPVPAKPGTTQTMTVSGLEVGVLYNFSICTWDEEDNPIQGAFATQVSVITSAYGQGIYDDADPAWSWSGSWSTYSGAGPYANSLHYSKASNATATFKFQAPAKFILTYTADTNRDKILVTVDTGPAIQINAKSTSTRWQQTYTSLMYSDNGIHTVTISSPGTGTYIDVDAIQIIGPPTSGIYDDNHSAWSWSGSWSTYSGAGPYANSLHYSNKSDATATFVFQGPAYFILTYSADTNRDKILVTVDTGPAIQINAKSTSTRWQQTYTSPMYSDNGIHTVTISSPGTGTYIDVDAIQIMGPPPAMAVGKYDDKDPAFRWGGSWSTYNGAGPYANSLHYSNKSDATATFRFQAPARFILTYTADTNRDKILVSVDGGTPIEINANAPSTRWYQTYTSPMYSDNGIHTVTISSPGTGTYIDVDAVQIVVPQPVMGVGTYDDKDPAFRWGGSWSTYNGAGPYANSLHYSKASDATATFVFQAPARFILTYTADTNRDKILVSVDGGAPITINAKSTGTRWQQTYTSAVYAGSGSHLVTISSPGTGTYIDVDAIQVVGPPPAMAVGKHDDMDSAFSWGGSWSTYNGAGPYANSLHYSNKSDATATFVFQAPARFILTYTADTNRDKILVSVDGGTPIEINAKSTGTLWQQTYISDLYTGTGIRIVTISSPGTGTYIDVDAVQIQ